MSGGDRRREQAPARPAYSVLMTAYRTEDTVGRAIGSVLDQTWQDWELVVVDNGRSEEMAAVVRAFLLDPRVRLVRQENRGASGGIRTAAEHARGRWLVVLNSDDVMGAETLSRMAAVAETFPDVAAVTSDALLFSDTGPDPRRTYLESAGQQEPVDPARPLRLADVVDGPCPYYTAAVRREVWDATGGMVSLRPDTSQVSDLDFWLRVIGDGHEVRQLPDRLGRYRIEAGSVSRPEDDAGAEEREDQLEATLRRAVGRSGAPEDRAALDRVLERRGRERALRRARAALRDGRTREAVTQYRLVRGAGGDTRTTAVLLGLRVAPRLVAAVHRWRDAR